MKTQIKKGGIIVPDKKKRGVQCGFCPAIIHAHKEAGGQLRLIKDKPICARCRILKGSAFKGQIKKGKKQYDAVIKEREDTKQKKADDQALLVAEASQKNNPSVKLSKK